MKTHKQAPLMKGVSKRKKVKGRTVIGALSISGMGRTQAGKKAKGGAVTIKKW